MQIFSSEKWLEYLKRPEYQSYLEDYKDENLCKAAICVKMLAHLLNDAGKALDMARVNNDSQTLISFSVNIKTNDGSPIIVTQDTNQKEFQRSFKNIAQSNGVTLQITIGPTYTEQQTIAENIPTIYYALHLMLNGTIQVKQVITGTEHGENLFPIPNPELLSNKEHIKQPVTLLPLIPPTNSYYEIYRELSRVIKTLSLEFYLLLTEKMSVDEILVSNPTQIRLLEFYLETLEHNSEKLPYIHLSVELKHFLLTYDKVLSFENQFNQQSSLHDDIQTTPTYNQSLSRFNYVTSGKNRLTSTTEIENVNNTTVYKSVEYALEKPKEPEPNLMQKFKEFINDYDVMRKSSDPLHLEIKENSTKNDDNDHLQIIQHYTPIPTTTVIQTNVATTVQPEDVISNTNEFHQVHNIDITFDSAFEHTTVRTILNPVSTNTENVQEITEKTELQEIAGNSDDDYESPLEKPPSFTVQSILVELQSNGKIEILKNDEDIFDHSAELFPIPNPDEKLYDTDLHDINNILPKFDQENTNYPMYIEARNLIENLLNDTELDNQTETYPTKIKYLDFLIKNLMSSSKEISQNLNEFLHKYHSVLEQIVEQNAEKKMVEKCKNEEDLSEFFFYNIY